MNRHLPILVGCVLSAQQVSVADAKEADPGDVAFCWKYDSLRERARPPDAQFRLFSSPVERSAHLGEKHPGTRSTRR
jgi:hypothetical protein